MLAENLAVADGGAVVVKAALAMIAAAEADLSGHAKRREHVAIHRRVQRFGQAQRGRGKAETLIVIEEPAARERQARTEHRGGIDGLDVLNHGIAAEVALVEAALRDAEFAGEQLRRAIERLAIGKPPVQPLGVRDVVIDADIGIVGLHGGRSAVVEVVAQRAGVTRLIRLRIILQHVARYGIEPGGGNEVARKDVADGAGSGRIRARGGRIEHGDQLSGIRPRLGKIPVALELSGYRSERVAELALAQAFERAHEERLVALDGAADGAAKLIPLEAGQRHAARIVEEIVGVQHGVPEELIRAAMERVAAGFVDQVQHAGHAASELGVVVLRLHLELFHGVDGGKDGSAGAAIYGGEVRRSAVHQGGEGAGARAIYAVADGVVLVAHRPGDSRRERDQAVDVTRIERQLEDPLVVHHLADR